MARTKQTSGVTSNPTATSEPITLPNMPSSGSAFSETLQTITTTKLEELAKKRHAFEQQRSTLVSKVQSEGNSLNRLLLLVDGVKSCFGISTVPLKKSNPFTVSQSISGGNADHGLATDLKNVDRFLEQARYDPSLSSKTTQAWEDCLIHHLSVQSLRYQYADLYGKLVTEWLSAEASTSVSGDTDVDMAESFEEVPGGKKLAARAEWEKSVFEPASVNVKMLQDFLGNLFGRDQAEKKGIFKALKALRERVQEFETRLATTGQFSVQTLHWSISGLLNSDLLTNEKRDVLRDFQKNPIILAEVADVLNMRMAGLESWSWGTYVPMEQRRKLNGTYGIYMHEDLLQAIFLQYIGVEWSVFLKGAFKEFRKDKAAWKSLRAEVPKIDRKRREYYLGHQNWRHSVQAQRMSTHRKNYFLFQLLTYEQQFVEGAEGEQEADFGDFVEEGVEDRERSKKRARGGYGAQVPQAPPPPAPAGLFGAPRRQLASKAARRSAPTNRDRILADEDSDEDEEEDSGDDMGPKKPMEVKQSLLRLLSTEIAVNTRLHGELTCFRSIFDQWSPSLPHASILSVLEFFGVSAKWRVFFTKFLQAPLKFTDEEDSQPRTRKRGTPGSHALSEVFGEVLLFCLDYSINQKTDGSLLYRLHEDIWFWSSDYEKVVKAWEATAEFARIMGVTLNKSKTGSVRIAENREKKQNIDSRLPRGQIRWGFLYLDPKTGQFEIDQEMIDSHVDELSTQLQSKSNSIFDWVSVWNAYAATFFDSNFGKAANCFGRKHVDTMLATHRRIQEKIFQGTSLAEFVKSAIRERFGIDNVPDGFLFFPVELGGLDLKSPFVNPLVIRDSVHESPMDLLDEFQENERDAYREAKKSFDKGDVENSRYSTDDPDWKPKQGADEFMSFEEFTKYREEVGPSVYTAQEHSFISTYQKLLERPTEQNIDVSVQVKQAIDQLAGQSNLRGITNDWPRMDAYWKWVTQLYGPEIIERFGRLSVVDPRLLPIGMIGLFRDKRVKWQG